jgi:hypothetical protein
MINAAFDISTLEVLLDLLPTVHAPTGPSFELFVGGDKVSHKRPFLRHPAVPRHHARPEVGNAKSQPEEAPKEAIRYTKPPVATGGFIGYRVLS